MGPFSYCYGLSERRREPPPLTPGFSRYDELDFDHPGFSCCFWLTWHITDTGKELRYNYACVRETISVPWLLTVVGAIFVIGCWEEKKSGSCSSSSPGVRLPAVSCKNITRNPNARRRGDESPASHWPRRAAERDNSMKMRTNWWSAVGGTPCVGSVGQKVQTRVQTL